MLGGLGKGIMMRLAAYAVFVLGFRAAVPGLRELQHPRGSRGWHRGAGSNVADGGFSQAALDVPGQT